MSHPSVCCGFVSSWYQKSTSAGLYTPFFAYCDYKYNVASAYNLFLRSFRLSSTCVEVVAAFEKVFDMFVANGYPESFLRSLAQLVLKGSDSMRRTDHNDEPSKLYIGNCLT